VEENFLVDVRGTACPQPVIKAKQTMKNKEKFSILMSQPDQADNVTRMAEHAGWTVEKTEMADHLKLTLKPEGLTREPEILPEDLTCSFSASENIHSGSLLVIASEFMGRGDPSLGKLLMHAFINTLNELDVKPERILLFNSAVKLAVTDSPVIESLIKLAENNVEILVCGTCLEYYQIRDKLLVGNVSNMYDIAESMLTSGVTYLS